MPVSPAFNILLCHDEDTNQWTAHCLEMDIVESGDDQKAALRMLFEVISEQMAEAKAAGVSYMKPAPSEFFEQFEKSEFVNLDDYFGEVTQSNLPRNLSVGECHQHVA